MRILELFYDKLTNDSTVTAQLATYGFSTGGAETPAVFTEKVPNDATYPCVVLSVVTSVPFDTRGQRGTDTTVDIRVYGNRNMTATDFRSLCEDVWKSVNRADLSPYEAAVGYNVYTVSATYPRTTPDTEGYPSAWVSCRIKALLDETL